jgi:hypothetical protein
MTKDSRDIPRNSWEAIYGRYESPDRGARSEFSDLDLSRIWVCVTSSGRPDDVGEDV